MLGLALKGGTALNLAAGVDAWAWRHLLEVIRASTIIPGTNLGVPRDRNW